jgi:acyl carrier protein
MTPTAHVVFASDGALPIPAASSAPSDETQLREVLKRCSPETIVAACAFRKTGDLALLPAIVRGVIARFVERERRAKLEHEADALHLIGDLGLDSLTMMEIVMLAEDVFPISISNDELRGLRTVGDVERFIACKLQGVAPPPSVAACACSRDGMPGLAPADCAQPPTTGAPAPLSG